MLVKSISSLDTASQLSTPGYPGGCKNPDHPPRFDAARSRLSWVVPQRPILGIWASLATTTTTTTDIQHLTVIQQHDLGSTASSFLDETWTAHVTRSELARPASHAGKVHLQDEELL